MYPMYTKSILINAKCTSRNGTGAGEESGKPSDGILVVGTYNGVPAILLFNHVIHDLHSSHADI